ncbi:MAG TPA: histidine kinase dimerization/phospho-acceptor domain-containing protein, partial [Chitinophagaceae bacterium]|nr:histidine kinase dimerization/phospho-acceptor domain-containing protein [Chitinophagaceae bacterium]
MKIKVKLVLGIGLLFAMILMLMALSTFQINRLSSDVKNILVANYNSLDYLRKMQIALDNNIAKNENLSLFSYNLALQKKNITETGEKELTDSLVQHFARLKENPADTQMQQNARKNISDIMLLNMLAIQRKSDVAKKTADDSILWITLAGAICFIIALTMLFNLPGNIANPIKQLTTSIKEIAAQNYSQRLHFEKHNEFGELSSAFNTMAQKLEEYKAGNLEKLMMEKKRIETLINNMSDPVIGLDENKKVLFMNNIALKIAGLSSDEIIGKPVQDIAMRNDLIRTLVKDLFETENENRQIQSMPVKIYADNKESYFEKEIIPIKAVLTGEKEEKHFGNVILLQNITPYKELDFAKTNFIATVSHELKTPISSIKMSLQLLENKQVGELNDEQKSLVDSIKEDAGRLLKITGELLNMTQVESGSIQMNIISSSAADIVDYAVNANKAAAEQKQIKFEIKIPAQLPKVLADNEKTSWVLTNLISNAVRYSYDNSVIYIDVTNEHEKIKFSVTDTGQGIPPQYAEKIFDRYFRIPGTKKEGTGLGLSISKEFIEAQGGQITVES